MRVGLGQINAVVGDLSGNAEKMRDVYARAMEADVDLLVLLNDGENKAATEALSRFLTLLWDLGLDIGHRRRCSASRRARSGPPGRTSLPTYRL